MKKLILILTFLFFTNYSYCSDTDLSDKVDIVFNVTDSIQYFEALNISKDSLLYGYNIKIIFTNQAQVNYISHNTGYSLGTLYSLNIPSAKQIVEHAKNAYAILFVFNKQQNINPILQKADFQLNIDKP